MTVSIKSNKNRRLKTEREYLFIFNDCEALTMGIIFLYRLRRNFKSALYKTDGKYRLIIFSQIFLPCFITLKEYCNYSSASPIEIAYTKEHGKLLIAKHAVKTFGKYFIKDF